MKRYYRLVGVPFVIASFALISSCSKTTSDEKKAELLIKRARVEMHTLIVVCEDYLTDTGHFPADVQYLYTKAQGGKGTNAYLWHRFDSDPWDKPFKFEFQTNHVVISSSGPDSRWNTEDDLQEERSLQQ
jgi:hypothetical protein